MASMKMFQVQFHTGFVPRNATTVKFAKYVGVTRGRRREGWSAQMPTSVTHGWGWEVWSAQISNTCGMGGVHMYPEVSPVGGDGGVECSVCQ